MTLRFVRSAGDAEDLAQEAFLRAYRGLDGFKGDARFSTWLYRITWNLCADWLRRKRKSGHASLSTDDASGVPDSRVGLEEQVLEAEERREVRRALDHLDEKYRGVLILLYYQKLTYEQIAAILDVPVKTVETRLYRARKLLKERLQRAGVGGAV